MHKRVYSLETEYALTHHIAGGAGTVQPFTTERLYAQLRDWLLAPTDLGQRPYAICDPTLVRGSTTRSSLVEVDEGFFIPSGARFYQDTGLFEWAAPESSSPKQALIYDLAADYDLAGATQHVSAQLNGGRVLIVKNNINYSTNASYGCHENYSIQARLMAPGRARDQTISRLVPFLITRQIMCGAGRIGTQLDVDQPPFFQLSQRSDLITVEASVDTRSHRPIVNTRDEPLSDPRSTARLHLILGDSNMAQVASLLKLGTTGLVLDMLEADAAFPEIQIVNPVRALHAVAHDLNFKTRLLLRGQAQASATALEIQWAYWRAASNFTAQYYPNDPDAHELLALWQRVLDAIERHTPALPTLLDWAIKAEILAEGLSYLDMTWEEMEQWQPVLARTASLAKAPAQAPWGAWFQNQLDRDQWQRVDELRQRAHLDWAHYGKARAAVLKLTALDLRYHEIDRANGLFYRLPDVESIIHDPAPVQRARQKAPSGTRAHVRSQAIHGAQARGKRLHMDWHHIRGDDPRIDLALLDPLDSDESSLKSYFRIIAHPHHRRTMMILKSKFLTQNLWNKQPGGQHGAIDQPRHARKLRAGERQTQLYIQ
ncbi:MAG: proteasome accessory factor PafA2 family protein [Chloroflexi bacterium]|uniref:proteasome accessory factor PafA2 family protein n=1 Tax=Candidatus Flexifilum breve TaxID=3140694 RepID=UPI00313622B9|nr:proteasome accessory factor PafA2 family protein [Chloroflexota bacterium]